MKRIVGVLLCLVLIVLAGCTLGNEYNEMDPSTIKDSGGQPPDHGEEGAKEFVNNFLGSFYGIELVGYLSNGQANTMKDALRLYLLSKMPYSGPYIKQATDDTKVVVSSPLQVKLDYKGPLSDEGTGDFKGELTGNIPYALIKQQLEANTDYQVSAFQISGKLSGEADDVSLETDVYDLVVAGSYAAKNLAPSFTIVQTKLRDEGEFLTDIAFSTDEESDLDPSTAKGNIELKFKANNAFSIKNSSGDGVKFTMVANNDVKSTWETLYESDDPESLMKQIRFDINIYDDSDNLITHETLSLYDMMHNMMPR